MTPRGLGPSDLLTVADASRLLGMSEKSGRAFFKRREILRHDDMVRAGALCNASDDKVAEYRFQDDRIYVVRCLDFVKIGHAKNPIDRMSDLQIGNPFALELVATYPGGGWIEWHLHKSMKAFRVRGEWFHWNDESRRLFHRTLREWMASL